MTDVASNLSDAVPQIEINVDPQKALKYGMTAAQVAQNLRSIYSGTTGVTKITLDGTSAMSTSTSVPGHHGSSDS
ncbi:hypothetical protein KDK_76310 [Dictyobacter kobayashii]|uniref:Uncharacterized protein n=1 Tax=Dictyobacter kobayashii TaxID=2014872 RepID=A0A402AXH8_9CHLR|nr:efflux RND transporter permease subunit [Dictyobacter kobayashii]GCE23831.1 hypothetical protein KDK_76310 [Dictyobacter kobayashii]